MIKVILIDDEPLSRELIRSYLSSYKELEIVEECNDGFEGVKAIDTHKPDLVFLDIQMPKINGFEMLELIDENPAIIFSTAFDEYAIKAFEKNATDYLLKPYSKERLDKAVKKFLDAHAKNAVFNAQPAIQNLVGTGDTPTRIVVKTGTKVKIIPVHEIQYMQSEDDFVKIVTAEGSYLKNRTMQFYEDHLDKTQFVRVHRSWMVHVNQVTKIDKYGKESHMLILRNGTKVPVSKQGYAKLKEVLGI
ncbi:MAG TPA: LytTR family transcriptional regulator DNA-binding domain-containing protein [Flavobacteriales bacterium]|nr:LytTR family transcriptional regulator DNA-binding domain-containing protein [Flavobacteriales bacterium]